MNVFELFGTIAINNRQANSALKDTASLAQKTGTQIRAAFQKAGEITIKAAKVIGTGAVAIGTAWAATTESTRDYRTAIAKLDTAFLTHNFSVDAARKTYEDLQAVLGETDQAVEAANHLAVMCDTEEELSKWTDICTGVFSTFGDSLPIEGLTEAANETAKVGQVTGPLADALNWAGISEDEFNKKLEACTSEQERQKLIMDTLYWTYRDAAEQYKKTGADVMNANRAQEKLNGAMAQLGAIGEPILTAIKSKVADFVLSAVPYLEKMIEKVKGLGTSWSENVWPMVQNALNVTLGIDLPDWETFKSNLKTKWTETKDAVSTFFSLDPSVNLPETAGFIEKVQAWWSGQGDNAYERVKSVLSWTLGTFVAPGLEAIGTWWNQEGGGEDKLLGLITWTLGDFIAPAIGDIVTTAGTTIAGWAAEFVQGVVDLLDWTLGELGLPTISSVVGKINAWWKGVVESLSLKFGATFEVNPTISGSGDPGTWENPYVSTGPYDNGWGSDYSVDGSHASGLDRVPRDGYIARVHRDEAILSREQAAQWRGGDTGRIESLLEQLVAIMGAGQTIQLDSGIIAGQLAPAIDARLGTIQARKWRGN